MWLGEKEEEDEESHPLGERTILEYRGSLSFCEKDLVNYLLAILQDLRIASILLLKRRANGLIRGRLRVRKSGIVRVRMREQKKLRGTKNSEWIECDGLSVLD